MYAEEAKQWLWSFRDALREARLSVVERSEIKRVIDQILRDLTGYEDDGDAIPRQINGAEKALALEPPWTLTDAFMKELRYIDSRLQNIYLSREEEYAAQEMIHEIWHSVQENCAGWNLAAPACPFCDTGFPPKPYKRGIL